MTAIPSGSTMRAALAGPVHRRVQAGPTTPVDLVSAVLAGADNPTAFAARWELGPTGLRLRWRPIDTPPLDDADRADATATIVVLRRHPVRLPTPSPDAA